jgi:hypothetical protein
VVTIGSIGLPREAVGQRLARMIVHERLERRALLGPPRRGMLGVRIHVKRNRAADRFVVR